MTDERDETIEEQIVVMQTPQLSEDLEDDGDNFDDEESSDIELSDEMEELENDLTPNDIFGLDPLDVLTLQEVADYLKVSTSAVHRMMKEQKLPGRNIGGEWRFLRDAIANWLRCEEAPAQQQQKSREEFSKAKPAARPAEEQERFSPPPRTSYQPEGQRSSFQSESSGGEYRPRQRFPEGGQQYGSQGGNQYGSRGGYSGGQSSGGGGYSGGQYSGGQSSGGGQYGRSGGQYGGQGSGGYTPPPRRPYRSEEGGYGSAGQGEGGYGGGNRYGGYQGGGQQFGGAKRKNKRQVFQSERGKRMDRRKTGENEGGEE